MSAVYAVHRDAFEISTDRARLDMPLMLRFLQQSYWGRGLPQEQIVASIRNALPFGVHHETAGQVGFARVVTDFARFAFLSDVFVLEAWRGRGLGVWLVDSILRHPQLQTLTRWHLGTDDAHGLYEKFGFRCISGDRFMNLVPDRRAVSTVGPLD